MQREEEEDDGDDDDAFRRWFSRICSNSSFTFHVIMKCRDVARRGEDHHVQVIYLNHFDAPWIVVGECYAGGFAADAVKRNQLLLLLLFESLLLTLLCSGTGSEI